MWRPRLTGAQKEEERFHPEIWCILKCTISTRVLDNLSASDLNWCFDIYTVEMFLVHISKRNTSTAGPFCLVYTKHMCARTWLRWPYGCDGSFPNTRAVESQRRHTEAAPVSLALRPVGHRFMLLRKCTHRHLLLLIRPPVSPLPSVNYVLWVLFRRSPLAKKMIIWAENWRMLCPL